MDELLMGNVEPFEIDGQFPAEVDFTPKERKDKASGGQRAPRRAGRPARKPGESEPGSRVNYTLALPADLQMSVRIYSAFRNVTIRDYIIDAISEKVVRDSRSSDMKAMLEDFVDRAGR